MRTNDWQQVIIAKWSSLHLRVQTMTEIDSVFIFLTVVTGPGPLSYCFLRHRVDPVCSPGFEKKSVRNCGHHKIESRKKSWPPSGSHRNLYVEVFGHNQDGILAWWYKFWRIYALEMFVNKYQNTRRSEIREWDLPDRSWAGLVMRVTSCPPNFRGLLLTIPYEHWVRRAANWCTLQSY